MKSISFSVSLIISLVLIGLTQTGLSQESVKKNAVVAFDIRGNQLMETETFGKIFKEGSIITMFTGTSVMPQRIFGASSLPDDFAFLQAPEPPKELPFDFFARIMMKDKDQAEEMADTYSIGAKETEVNGKKYSLVGPLLLHQPDEKSIEVGNQDYITPKGRRFFTPRLTKAFAATPNVSIRIAIDLDTQKQSVAKMIDLQIEQLKGLEPGVKGVAEAFLNCVKNVSEVSIGIGLQSENIVSIEAVGYDEAKATEFKEALDSVIGLAQFSRKPFVDMLRGESKQLGDDVDSIIQNAKVTIDGTKVSLVVPNRPNFDKTLAATMNFDFGFGGPGPGAESMEVETEYDPRPIPAFDSSQKLSDFEAKMPQQLKKSCFPASFWGTKLRVDVDPIELKNLDLYKFQYKVVSIKSKDGKLELLGKGDERSPVDEPRKLWISSSRGAHIELPITLDEVKLESTKDKDGKDLRPRQIEELKKEQIGSAEVEVIVSGAEAVTVFELTQDDPKQEKNGVRAKLSSISGSSVTVTYKGDSIQIYAFDETGKRLRQRGSSGTTGRKSAFFAGQPKKVTAVVLSGEKKTITCPVTIDLNGGKRIELPDEPSDDIPIRYGLELPRDFKSVTQAEMDALEVKYDSSEERFGPRHSFYVDFPNPKAEVIFNWE